MEDIRFFWNAARQNKNWNLSYVAVRFLLLLTLLFRPCTHRQVCQTLTLPKFSDLAQKLPRTPFKYLSNLYLARGLTISARASALIHHYRYLDATLSKDFIHKILFQRAPVWGTNVGTCHYDINLSFSRESKYEGELTLYFQANGVDIFHLAFSIVPGWIAGVNSNNVLLISRTQGALGRFQEIRLATKALHEVAPASVLFASLCGIAEAFGISYIVGVCAANQPCNQKHDSIDFENAYDKFWISLGATKSSCDFFPISLPLSEKPIQSIAQKHRARTLAKRQLKRRITEETHQSLQLQQA